MADRSSFDLSGLGVSVRGLPRVHRERLEAEWSPFVSLAAAPPLLDVAVESEPEAAGESAPFAPKEMTAGFEGGAAVYSMKEGTAHVGAAGEVRIRLASGTADRQFYGFVNLLTAALAFRLPSRGGALLHAAGIVLDGRAFVLVGAEGTGKTTWAHCARQAGAHVLSDDVVLVDRAGDGSFLALGTPLRDELAAPPRPGRWPLAALLFPEHGEPARLEPTSALLVQARLAANLPFLDEAFTVVEALAGRVPARSLVFAPDASFVGLLRAFAS